MGMTSELEMAPRLNGRAAVPLQAAYARDLTEADLALLSTEAGTQAPARKRLRDRHHALARLLAEGAKPWEASAVTGYSSSTISILQADPTFKELVEFYKANQDAAYAEFSKRANTVLLTLADNLQELAENEEVPLTFDQNLTGIKTLADRLGYAPIARSVNTNVNVELSGRLSAAKARLAERALKQLSSPARDSIPEASVLEGEIVRR